MGIMAHVVSARCKSGPTLTDRACPRPRSHLLLHVKLSYSPQHLSTKRSLPLSRSALADVHEPNDPRRKATAFTGPLHSNSALSLHPGNVTCLKITHPKYIQHNPHPPVFFPKLNPTTAWCWCPCTRQRKSEDNRAERTLMAGRFDPHCSVSYVCAYDCRQTRAIEKKKHTVCSCSVSVSDPVPRLTGSLSAHTVSKRVCQLVFSH